MCGLKMRRAMKVKAATNKMVYEYFADTATKYPNKPALIAIGLNGRQDRTLTFQQLEDYINQIANCVSLSSY